MSLSFKMDSTKFKRESGLYIIFIFVFMFASYFFYTTGKKFYTDISKILKETEEVKTDTELLTEKISSLKSIKNNFVSDMNTINIIFQPEDPSLFMFSQLKVLSVNNNVQLLNIYFSEGPPVGNISTGVVGFTVKGIKEDVYRFFSDLSESAPLLGFGSMSFSGYVDSGDELELNMSLDVFYSPYPEVLPDTDKVVNPLTSDEIEAYENIKKLKILSKTDFIIQDPNDDFTNPFDTVIPDQEIKSE